MLGNIHFEICSEKGLHAKRYIIVSFCVNRVSPTICIEIGRHICGYSWTFFQQYNYFLNLCHFRMTPLRIILQHVNNAPYTTPAKIGLKIGPRACCRNVISSRGLFRLDLNISLQIAGWTIYA